MKYLTFIYISILFFLLQSNTLWSQKTFVDHKPNYTKWQDSYILDKIEYTKNRTIFHFRFVSKSSKFITATFYPKDGESPWYIEGKTTEGIKKTYPLIEVKKIIRNGKLMASKLRRTLTLKTIDEKKYTVFSCEVHFPRFDNKLKRADLIEGKGQRYNRNHFNCLRIALKTWDSSDLGKIADSNNNIKTFEKKYNVSSKVEKPKKPTKPKEPIIAVVKKDPPTAKPKSTEQKKQVITPKDKNPYPNKRLRNYEDIACNKNLTLDQIKFQDNSTNFRGMVLAKRTMFIIYNFLKDNPNATVTIHGHTDIFGNKERNLALSKSRAFKIKRWLGMYGTDLKRIECKWHGSQKPIKAEGSPINRRIELYVKCE